MENKDILDKIRAKLFTLCQSTSWIKKVFNANKTYKNIWHMITADSKDNESINKFIEKYKYDDKEEKTTITTALKYPINNVDILAKELIIQKAITKEIETNNSSEVSSILKHVPCLDGRRNNKFYIKKKK